MGRGYINSIIVATKLYWKVNLTSRTMRFEPYILSLCFVVASAAAQNITDGCPKGSLACMDVINSSQCIEQIIIEKRSPVTADALVKCVVFEGASSNLTGAGKVCLRGGDNLHRERWLTNAKTVLSMSWLPLCAYQCRACRNVSTTVCLDVGSSSRFRGDGLYRPRLECYLRRTRMGREITSH